MGLQQENATLAEEVDVLPFSAACLFAAVAAVCRGSAGLVSQGEAGEDGPEARAETFLHLLVESQERETSAKTSCREKKLQRWPKIGCICEVDLLHQPVIGEMGYSIAFGGEIESLRLLLESPGADIGRRPCQEVLQENNMTKHNELGKRSKTRKEET